MFNASQLKCTLFTATLGILFSFSACKKTGIETLPVIAPDPFGIVVPAGFNYVTSQLTQIDITVQAPDGSAITNIPVAILDKNAADSGRVLFEGFTSAEGKLTGQVLLPAYMTTVVVDAAYTGVPGNLTVGINSGNITALLGGPKGYGGNVIPDQASMFVHSTNNIGQLGLAPFKFLGAYDDKGYPKYLEPVNDVIDSKLLGFVNASLPEQKPVQNFHPDYLKTDVATNLVIVEKSEVSITFVSGITGNTNSLFYYSYPTNKPPLTVDDIVNPTLVIPNTSMAGAKGSMVAGNKVKLGVFESGTTLAFGILVGGWNGNSKTFNPNVTAFFGNDALNPETNILLKRHTVLLHDVTRKIFLTGFEDTRRDGRADNDFNDLVFYTTANPFTAISPDKVNPVDQPVDTDKDGITDMYDKFPNDPTKALIRYFPSENTFGTLAFEDLWPGTGDYDMNDLVVEYRYKLISNGQNRAVEMEGIYKIAAIGATFTNGFGVQLPVVPNVIKSISGVSHSGKLNLSLAANGTENGQAKAVFVPFDNAFNLFSGIPGFVNTYKGSAFQKSKELNVLITFTAPQDGSNFSSMTFNPFLIRNGNRGFEIHLPGMEPTDKADKNAFNTLQDNTLPAQNKFYKTKNNLPFATGFVETFKYPAETVNIKDAYLKFSQWVSSGGVSFTDWYKTTTSGYRVDAKIY